ncbi:MAG: RNA polymerase factor sigma-54 [Clostridiaceae bacterium]
MDFNLNLEIEQKLILTQKMQLSIKILQMSSLELTKYIEKESIENPLLEVQYKDFLDDEVNKKIKQDNVYKDIINSSREFVPIKYQYAGEDDSSPFNYIAIKKTLKDYLIEQINELYLDKQGKKICIYLIENIDKNGYMPLDTEELIDDLEIDNETMDKYVDIIKSLDPPGIGASDIKECLIIQIERQGIEGHKLKEIVNFYLEDIASNRYNEISKKLHITKKQVQEYKDIITKLEPKPSRGFYTGEETKYVMPDAYIREIGGKFYIIMNEDVHPKLNINNVYKDIIDNSQDKKTQDYVKEKIDSALFLIKSINQRKNTIYKVLEKILNIQIEYFTNGGNIKPMTLRQIADGIGVHESTVSRAIKDKYLYTGKETIKIKDLFTSKIVSLSGEDVSSLEIKDKIKEIISEEDKKNPLSDEVISKILKKYNMNISRRTVAKYREEVGLGSSSKRKRY